MHLRSLLALACAAASCNASAQAADAPAQVGLAITLQITDARAAPPPQQRSDAAETVPPQVQALSPALSTDEAAQRTVTVTY